MMVLSLIVLFICFTRCFTKPLTSETRIPRGQTIYSHELRDQVFQSRDQEYRQRDQDSQSGDQGSQTQGNVFQPDKSIDKESEVTSIVKDFLNKHVASNRTARDANNPCFDHMERKWDSCRQKDVYVVHCHTQHVACYRAMNQGYLYPACEVVLGFRQAKYISKCPALPIDCQCAA